MPLRKPPRLRPGDTVGLVAPASPWENRSELLRAVAALEAWELRVKVGAHVDDRHGYLAGRDEDRAADLHAMYADPEVRAIFGFQGGYGSPRLVPLLDRAVIAANPKALCGYSDITTLHLAIASWSETITFYSNGASGIGSPEVTDWSKATLHRALFSDEPYGDIAPNPDDPYVRAIRGGVARGRLTGGCAGLVASTLGTAIEIDTRDRILVLEEIELDTEDFDAMLTHLRNAGQAGRRIRDRRRRRTYQEERLSDRAVHGGRARGAARPSSASRSCTGCRSATASTTPRCRSAPWRSWTPIPAGSRSRRS